MILNKKIKQYYDGDRKIIHTCCHQKLELGQLASFDPLVEFNLIGLNSSIKQTARLL